MDPSEEDAPHVGEKHVDCQLRFYSWTRNSTELYLHNLTAEPETKYIRKNFNPEVTFVGSRITLLPDIYPDMPNPFMNLFSNIVVSVRDK